MAKLKIYQIFHNRESYKNCSNGKHITKLNVGKGLFLHNDYEKINNIFFNTNQLSESRAFYYAYNNIESDLIYIGFTSHKHNYKFNKLTYKYCPFSCIKIEDIDLDLVDKCFSDNKIKLLSFLPTIKIIEQTEELFHPGMVDFILKWMKDKYDIGNSFKKDLIKWSKTSYVPYSNAFVMKTKEFKRFFNFFDNFITYADKKYDINKYNLEIPVIDKSRGWGYFCERIIAFYLFYKYKNKFKIVYIDKDKKIGILNN